MKWNNHYNLRNAHAILGASNYHWLGYDEAKLRDAYSRMKLKERGTRMHALAAELIDLKIKLQNNDVTFNRYVNDAISFRMTPEQILYFSEYCFGTADTISFRKGTLRIHDLKTGSIPANMKQLEIYAALFCLEYDYNPCNITIILRLYQNDEVSEERPDPDLILHIMDKIKTGDKLLRSIEGGQ